MICFFSCNMCKFVFKSLAKSQSNKIKNVLNNSCNGGLSSRSYSNLESCLWKVPKMNGCINYRKIHSTSKPYFSTEMPDYVKKIANVITHLEEESIDIIDELENDMEDEIIEFLQPRSIIYEELENSFIVTCPSCGPSDSTREMFIDKNTGYCVCPWCCWDGNWEDLIKLFDAKEDSLTHTQLDNFFLSIKPIEESHASILSSSSLKNVDISILKAIQAGITDEQDKIVFPLQGECGDRIGYASLPLHHPKPKIIQRVLEVKSGIFFGLPLPNSNFQRNLISISLVSTIFEALHLAQFGIHSAVIISDPSSSILKWAFQSLGKLIVWLKPSSIPQNLLLYLPANNISSYAVKITNEQRPITSLSKIEICRLLSDAQPLLFKSILSFSDIRSKVYSRISNKDYMNGIKWSRYTELNELLLGHREGELTVFSGQTGTGKTTFMSEYSLDLCMQGVSTLWGSFEVNIARLCEIMLHQFTGKALPEDYYEFCEVAEAFSQLPLYFLDAHGQQPLQDTINTMTEAALIHGVQHVVIDNLQFMLGADGHSVDWWLQQDKAVSAFRQFATSFNCHVTVIVHPRKLSTGHKLSVNSISGGARITQEADNVMILHVKENQDGTPNTAGPKTLQVAKNRYGGTLGEMRLNFHKESLTFSNIFRVKKKLETKDAKGKKPREKLLITDTF